MYLPHKEKNSPFTVQSRLRTVKGLSINDKLHVLISDRCGAGTGTVNTDKDDCLNYAVLKNNSDHLETILNVTLLEPE